MSIPEPAAGAGSPEAAELFETLRTALGRTAASVLVQSGRAVPATWNSATGDGDSATFGFGPADTIAAAADMLGSVQGDGDALVRLNDAFAPDPIFVDVPGGVTVDAPVLVVHWCEPGVAAFPRLCVRAGTGAAVSVVEVFAGPPASGPGRSLVVPITELLAADDASVSYVSLQTLADNAWSHRPALCPRWQELVGPHVHRRARWRLRPDPHRCDCRRKGRPQRDPLDVSR